VIRESLSGSESEYAKRDRESERERVVYIAIAVSSCLHTSYMSLHDKSLGPQNRRPYTLSLSLIKISICKIYFLQKHSTKSGKKFLKEEKKAENNNKE